MKPNTVNISLDKKTEKQLKEITESLSTISDNIYNSSSYTLQKYYADQIDDSLDRLKRIEALRNVHLTPEQMETITVYTNHLADSIIEMMEKDNDKFRFLHPDKYMEFIDRHLKSMREEDSTFFFMEGPLGTVLINEKNRIAPSLEERQKYFLKEKQE